MAGDRGGLAEGHSPSVTRAEGAYRRWEVGTVVAVRGELAEVRLPRGRRCEGCGSCCVAADGEAMVAEALNPVGAKPGDRVEVELPVSVSLRAAYILYGVPLLFFLGGLALGAALGWLLTGGRLSLPLSLVLGFGMTSLSYYLLHRRYSPGSRASSPYRPVVTRIL